MAGEFTLEVQHLLNKKITHNGYNVIDQENKGVSVMSYNHLTINERESILELLTRKHSIRSIAIQLKRAPSTISR